MDITKLDAQSILSDEVLEEWASEPDEIEKAKLLLALQDKAKLVGVKGKFDLMVAAYKRVQKEIVKANQEKPVNRSFDNFTQFNYFDDGKELYCGNWIADEQGVRTFNMFGEQLACYHPIMITQRLVNAETGKEKIKIAFKKGRIWKEIVVDKGMIASSNKIVGLADFGVSVTSESSKALVRFLSDIENYNIEEIDTRVSTSKFGWINGEFMPYGENVEFDGEGKSKDIFESIEEHGSSDKWFDLIKNIRQTDRIEPRLYMAGSFASVLLNPLNILPFFLNLWGESGRGKTVALMVATSIWANPGESKYITDPNDSVVNLELRCNLLNHLPIIIDDLSKMRDKYGDNFTDIIYMLCGGKGKGRSNVNLEMRKVATWQNCILTNIERPLAGETMRGGAVNRILDFEMADGSIFENGNRVVEIINKNYGFAGPLFIEVVKSIGFDEIRSIQEDFLQQINDKAKALGVEKEEKQTLPLSAILTADKIATDYIFHDDVYLDLDYCVDALKDKGAVSENTRAYDFILSEVQININKFKPDNFGEYKGEVWGCIENGYVIILKNAFDRMAEKGNFSGKAFLQWAAKNGFIVTSGGKNTKNKRFGTACPRCVWLKMQGNDDFVSADDFEYAQEELPFD